MLQDTHFCGEMRNKSSLLVSKFGFSREKDTLSINNDNELCVYRISLLQLQSTLVISNSNGPSEILRDIRTLTYQICRIQGKIIQSTTNNKYICNWDS